MKELTGFSKVAYDFYVGQWEHVHKEVHEILDRGIKVDGQLEYPSRPDKPVLASKHSSDDVIQYATSLAAYEKKKSEYDSLQQSYRIQQASISTAKEEFIKHVTSFYDYVPKLSQDKVWSKAYQDGHSSGYYSVYQELDELVDLFGV